MLLGALTLLLSTPKRKRDTRRGRQTIVAPPLGKHLMFSPEIWLTQASK
jgi:hypothetical protein